VELATVRWIVIDDMLTNPSETSKNEISVPLDKDLLIIVHASGYKRWFYIDPSNTSGPTL
jgi:hypothetical protein